jgi:hypothetical protein
MVFVRMSILTSAGALGADLAAGPIKEDLLQTARMIDRLVDVPNVV